MDAQLEHRGAAQAGEGGGAPVVSLAEYRRRRQPSGDEPPPPTPEPMAARPVRFAKRLNAIGRVASARFA
jgi:hypothetical protein